MEQDLRKLFEAERKTKTFPMKANHEARFLERLSAELPQRKTYTKLFWMRIAASVVVLLAVSIYLITESSPNVPINTTVVEHERTQVSNESITLGDLSPDLQKIENYYVSNINFELYSLEVSNNNKEMVDGFMERLAELNEEYNILQNELNELGPNDETISALIQNLQLRLQLLQKLKQKLNQLKSSENEQKTNII